LTAHYSYRWADEVVQRLEAKHTRATVIVCEILNVTHRNLVAFLAINDPAFAQIRDLIHNVNNVLQMPGKGLTDDEWKLFLRRKLIRTHNERFLERLDVLYGNSKL